MYHPLRRMVLFKPCLENIINIFINYKEEKENMDKKNNKNTDTKKKNQKKQRVRLK
jgi:hypothetical protein